MNNKVQIALGILSGRITKDNISSDKLDSLGFAYYYSPTENELKQKAENIVYNAIYFTDPSQY